VNYTRFFQESKRVSGSNKKVIIVNPDLFNEFMEAVASDTELELPIKAFVLIAASSGGRVSEVIGLHKKDFNSNLFDLNVLKKGKERTRKCRLHPAAIPVVAELLKHRKPQEFLFRFDRNHALYAIKKYFGSDIECHSFRHSHVSYLMNKGMTHIKIAKLVDIEVHNVSRYSHLNQTKALEDIF
jgi:integrase